MRYRDPLDEPTTRKEPRFPRAKPKTRRKQWAVWLLLQDGSGWEYSTHAGIVDAWSTAKALAGLRDKGRTWIAHVDQPAHWRRHEP